MKKTAFLSLALLLAFAGPALAQSNAAQPQVPGYIGGNINGQAVTAASATQSLPANANTYFVLTVVNYGTKDVYVAFGASATTAGIPVRTGKAARFLIPPGTTQVSEICGGTDTSTVDLIQSSGVVQ